MQVRHSNYTMLKLHFIINQPLDRPLETYTKRRFYSYKMPGKYEIFEIQYFIYSVLCKCQQDRYMKRIDISQNESLGTLVKYVHFTMNIRFGGFDALTSTFS